MYTSAPAGRKATASSKTSTTRERCNLLNGTLDWNDSKSSQAPSSTGGEAASRRLHAFPDRLGSAMDGLNCAANRKRAALVSDAMRAD